MTTSINRTALLAGWLYLALIPFSVLGFFYVPSVLIVPGDAATTSRNILASELLFGPRLSLEAIDALFSGNEAAQRRAYLLSTAVVRYLMQDCCNDNAVVRACCQPGKGR